MRFKGAVFVVKRPPSRMLTKIGLLALAFVLVVPAVFTYRAHVESAPTTIEQFEQTCFDSVWKVVLLFLVFLGLEQGVRVAVRQGTVASFWCIVSLSCP